MMRLVGPLRSIPGVWFLLTSSDRKRVVVLFGIMLVAAVGQMVAISLIPPFLGLAMDPGYIAKSTRLANIYAASGAATTGQFISWLGICLVLVLLVTNFATLAMLAGSHSFAWALNRQLSTRLLRLYLQQRYEFFAARNSTQFAHSVLVEIQTLAGGTILPTLDLLSRALLVVLILVLLLIVDPQTTMIAGGFFAVIYIGLFRFLQRRLHTMGAEGFRQQGRRFKLVHDAFGSTKETRVLQRENCFLESYDAATRIFSRCNAEQVVLGQSPRLLIETLAFGGIVVVVLVFLNTGGNLATLIPKLTLFAMAGYRLIPALQQIFASLSNLQVNETAVCHLVGDLGLKPDASFRDHGLSPVPALRFVRSITLKGVSFNYEKREKSATHEVNLSITKGEMVAFCGPTGSGKTTMVDLIMGLLRPKSGELQIDGRTLDSSEVRAWQANFGYVPQGIFLLDASVRENVAFGLTGSEIDMAKVEAACRMACIHDFIVSELPGGYESEVGDCGVRLSGGQRQRIGLARALYHDPEILVLDEATSALDSETERYVMDAIQEVAKSRTVILIAHRLSTVRRCDRIFYLDQGRLVANGSYDELITTCPGFAISARDKACSAGEDGQ